MKTGAVRARHRVAALNRLFRTRGLEEMAQEYDGAALARLRWGGGTLDLTLCQTDVSGMMVEISNDGTDEVGGDQFDDTILNYVDQESLGNAPSRQRRPRRHSAGAKARLLEQVRAREDRSILAKSGRNLPSAVSSADLPSTATCTMSCVRMNANVWSSAAGSTKAFEAHSRSSRRTPVSRLEPPWRSDICHGGMSNMPARQASPVMSYSARDPSRDTGRNSDAHRQGAAVTRLGRTGRGFVSQRTLSSRWRGTPTCRLLRRARRCHRKAMCKGTSTHLYCTDPRDGVAKFQFCAPKRPVGRCVRTIRESTSACSQSKLIARRLHSENVSN